MSDPGPHCLIWLPLYHRMAAVETGNCREFSNGKATAKAGLDIEEISEVISMCFQWLILLRATHATRRTSPDSDTDVKSVTRINCVRTASGVAKSRARTIMITRRENTVVLYVSFTLSDISSDIFRNACERDNYDTKYIPLVY